MTSASDGSSSSRPAEGTTAGPGVAPRAMTGISAPPALDRSGERRALEALRALLQNPPAAVEDDLPSQDWLAGLACMADYALLCNSAAMADAASGPERHRAAGINLSARETGSIAPPASGGGRRANHRQSHRRLAGSEARPDLARDTALDPPPATTNDLHRVMQGLDEPLVNFTARFRSVAGRVTRLRDGVLIAAYEANVRHPQLRSLLLSRIVHSAEELWRIVHAYFDADGPGFSSGRDCRNAI